jgi:hypothetical protein
VAVEPSYPASLDVVEADLIADRARSLGVQAWEARILLRANHQPKALLWRQLHPARRCAAFPGYAAAGAILPA